MNGLNISTQMSFWTNNDNKLNLGKYKVSKTGWNGWNAYHVTHQIIPYANRVFSNLVCINTPALWFLLDPYPFSYIFPTLDRPQATVRARQTETGVWLHRSRLLFPRHVCYQISKCYPALIPAWCLFAQAVLLWCLGAFGYADDVQTGGPPPLPPGGARECKRREGQGGPFTWQGRDNFPQLPLSLCCTYDV